jgi:BMFP domain-containing protein YqiC
MHTPQHSQELRDLRTKVQAQQARIAELEDKLAEKHGRKDAHPGAPEPEKKSVAHHAKS